ncbi:fimbrial protein [Acinetobacter guillouiae]|uniref:fimbrial protein n=1 Tax=Acinetobacter guillouiae TaxID=106649 RepID=UPI001CD7DA35|nr:type 1 fimbrial protein [Acinetobacter guillouiae]
MKKCTLPILGALALSLACSSVFAADGTITVSGVITDGTCTLQGSSEVSGLKDLMVNLDSISKSEFTPTHPRPGKYKSITLQLMNATGTGPCDAVTGQALQGVHLSAISPADLDATDKTLLVNKAEGAFTTNPVFIQIITVDFISNDRIVDFSAPWGVQAKSVVYSQLFSGTFVAYDVKYASKTGIVDAQNVQVKINYTLHYN